MDLSDDERSVIQLSAGYETIFNIGLSAPKKAVHQCVGSSKDCDRFMYSLRTFSAKAKDFVRYFNN